MLNPTGNQKFKFHTFSRTLSPLSYLMKFFENHGRKETETARVGNRERERESERMRKREGGGVRDRKRESV